MRVYANREDNGRRILIAVTCDGQGCDAEIKPNPDIVSSGWILRGTDHGPGTDKLEWYYCPRCA